MRSRRGTLIVRLEGAEPTVLDGVLGDLLTALDGLGEGDPVWQRLNPAVYADAEATAEFRGLVVDDLDRARRERLEQCREELAVAGSELRLDRDGVQRWLTALNDVRLALGTRLDIGADEDARIDPDDPQGPARAVYHWLTALQDGLVQEAMSS